MRRLPIVAALAGVLMICVPTVALCSGNAFFIYSDRHVHDDFRPVDHHAALGMTVFVDMKSGPSIFSIGVQISGDKARTGSDTFESDVTELYAGVGKLWSEPEDPSIYITGGVTFMNVESKLTDAFGSSVNDDDSTIAPYVEGGFLFMLAPNVNIGFGARYVFLAELDAFGVEADADVLQINGLIGWGW